MLKLVPVRKRPGRAMSSSLDSQVQASLFISAQTEPGPKAGPSSLTRRADEN